MAPRILIVEDHQTMREAIRLVLEPEGFEILEAGDGPSAIDAVRSGSPDLVLLDLGIPRIPGADVLEVLKGDPKTAWVPVVILTATGEEARDRVMALGAAGNFTKPLSPVASIRTMARVLDERDGSGS